MIAEHFERLERAPDEGRKVVYTFVPGNLTELFGSLDLLPVLPEINALQSGMRGLSAGYIAEAEKSGHSEDVCTYVKCDLGMSKSGNVGPTGTKLPRPDLLLLSYTGCFTFLKWFELLREEYDCPVAMLHVPYQADGRITDEMRATSSTSSAARWCRRSRSWPAEARRGALAERLERSRRAEDDLVAVWESARRVPSPIDAYFGGVYYVGPIFSAFRGGEDAVAYYRELRAEVEGRIERGEGPPTPDGPSPRSASAWSSRGRRTGPASTTSGACSAREGAVAVASTYTKVGGLYDDGFRHDPERPLRVARRLLPGCYTNLCLPGRVELLERISRTTAPTAS
jgi:benzoyl-CoA reductase subunit B